MDEKVEKQEVTITLAEMEEKSITPVGQISPKPAPTTKLGNLGRKFKSTAFMRFMVWLIKRVMFMLWPTKVLFKERFNIEGKAIVTCNHYGLFDTNPIINAFYKKKDVSIMLKQELMAKDDFKAHFLDEIGGIPVNRHKADITAVKRALKALSSGRQLLIYPEGTRNRQDTKEMGKIEEGTAMFAIKAQAPIIPLIYYRCTKWNRKNYLLVGHPFTLEEFYGDRSPDVKKKATEVIAQKYAELRSEIDEIVEVYKGSEKKYKKAHGIE